MAGRLGGKRRAARDVISDYAIELSARAHDPDVKHKLATIEVIALRMNWKDLYNRLRFSKNVEKQREEREQWWQK